jgi:type II secretory ATPase GspE/PulE/Tfp pilus assembly ATPase PilB-like protein
LHVLPPAGAKVATNPNAPNPNAPNPNAPNPTAPNPLAPAPTQTLTLGDKQISIGRGPENTIPLLDEQASRRHAIIERSTLPEGDFVVRDLGSRNGTKLNGIRVEQAALRHDDVVRVGTTEFRLRRDPPPLPDAIAMDATVTSATNAGLAMEFDGPGIIIDTERTGMSVDDALAGLTPELRSISLNKSTEVGWMFELAGVLQQLPPKEDPPKLSIIDSTGRPTNVFDTATDGPNCLRLLLQLASKARATDIHWEPKGTHTLVRLRVDGEMAPIIELPPRVGELAYGVIKSACHMQVAGKDAVQDGHFSCVFPDRRVEYRISFTPSVHGQKLVTRVLDAAGSPQALGELGLSDAMHERLSKLCEQDSGLILTCGPTGSGKTTTLYNALRSMDRQSRNVVTIEDPVEYQLSGVTQIPVDEARGNHFGALLRSVLRQDPDVILVGEIRDEETARTAMQAALTGHLVFSSVHSKDSITAIFRLLDLKVEPYLVANSLSVILAQRLVRLLCDTCKAKVQVTPGQSTRMGRFLGGKSHVFGAVGCARCLRTGYKGRRALFELLDVNDDLRDVILNKPTIAGIKRVLEQTLFNTLQQSGWRLIGDGVTTIDEVEKVAMMS